jgi:hypothetical protein
MSTVDEVGFDGVTLREAIASRTLEAVNRLMDFYKEERLSFDQMHFAVTVLIEANLPFVDPGSKVLIAQVQAHLRREEMQRAEANEELSALAEAMDQWVAES